MSSTALDTAAWSSRWRARPVQDKALLTLGLSAAAAWLPAWPGSLLVALTAAVLTLGPARTPWRLWLRCLAAPLVFIALGAVSVAVVLQLDGGPALVVTPASLTRAGAVVGHSVAGTLALVLLAVTTPMVDVLAGLRRLRLPDACVEVASLTYRMLFVLLDSVVGVRQAQEARLGYTSLRRGLQSAALLTAAVLVRSWDRARRLDEGLTGRGYAGSLRTLDDAVPTSRPFVAAVVAGLATLVAASLVLGRLAG